MNKYQKDLVKFENPWDFTSTTVLRLKNFTEIVWFCDNVLSKWPVLRSLPHKVFLLLPKCMYFLHKVAFVVSVSRFYRYLII